MCYAPFKFAILVNIIIPGSYKHLLCLVMYVQSLKFSHTNLRSPGPVKVVISDSWQPLTRSDVSNHLL